MEGCSRNSGFRITETHQLSVLSTPLAGTLSEFYEITVGIRRNFVYFLSNMGVAQSYFSFETCSPDTISIFETIGSVFLVYVS